MSNLRVVIKPHELHKPLVDVVRNYIQNKYINVQHDQDNVMEVYTRIESLNVLSTPMMNRCNGDFTVTVRVSLMKITPTKNERTYARVISLHQDGSYVLLFGLFRAFVPKTHTVFPVGTFVPVQVVRVTKNVLICRYI